MKGTDFFLPESDAGLCNAVRRSLLSDVRAWAPRRVTFRKNTSCQTDEFLAHRIGLIPFRRVGNGDTMNLQTAGPQSALAADFVGPAFEAVHPDIPIMVLADENQVLDLTVHFEENTASEHARFCKCAGVGMRRWKAVMSSRSTPWMSLQKRSHCWKPWTPSYTVWTRHCRTLPTSRSTSRRACELSDQDQETEPFGTRKTMHAEAHACIAFSLASGAQNSLEDASLHSTLLHHASASRILSDHVDPELCSGTGCRYHVGPTGRNYTGNVDEQVDEAVRVGRGSGGVIPCRVAFSIVELHLSMTLPLPRVLP